MAWRIAENVVRGEIDNRLPGIIKGTLYLEGLNNPIVLELEGDCDPDLAGRHLTFRNLMTPASRKLDGLGQVQCGEAGAMTACYMVRIPTVSQEEVDQCIREHKPIPTRWSESLYLEWFGPNGRVLVEGSSFACRLSPAKWKLSEQAHEWFCRLKEREACTFLDDEPDSPEDDLDEVIPEEPSGMKRPWGFRTATVDGLKPHPFVQNASDLLLQVIFESKIKRIYVEEAIENQPLEAMIDAMSSATVRSAHALASLNGSLLRQESRDVVHGLKQARWSLAQAAAHADLAHHVSVVDPAWLKGLRVEFTRMRKELRRLIHMYEEPKPGSAPAAKADPTETRS